MFFGPNSSKGLNAFDILAIGDEGEQFPGTYSIGNNGKVTVNFDRLPWRNVMIGLILF